MNLYQVSIYIWCYLIIIKIEVFLYYGRSVCPYLTYRSFSWFRHVRIVLLISVRWNIESVASLSSDQNVITSILNMFFIIIILHTYLHEISVILTFGMMILRKINFDIIWYSVIFAATLLLFYSWNFFLCNLVAKPIYKS